MTSFKLYEFTKKAFVLASVAAILASCVKPSTHSKDTDSDEQASFFLSQVTSPPNAKVVDLEVSPIWRLPAKRQFSFQVCAFDRRTRNPVIGHRFDIPLGDGSTASQRSDINGCIVWSEAFPINVLADAKAIEVKREIHAVGLVTGFRRIDVAIFPWMCASCRSGDVVDLKDGQDANRARAIPPEQLVSPEKAQAAMAGLSEGKGQVLRSLWYREPTPSFSDAAISGVGNGGQLLMNLSFTPVVNVKNLIGQVDPLPLLAGRFKLIADAYATLPSDQRGGRARRVHIGHGVSAKPVAITGGLVSDSIPFIVSSRNITGKTEIVLQVRPIDGPASLGVLTTRYVLNSGSTLVGRLQISPEETSAEVSNRYFAQSDFYDTVEEDSRLCALIPAYPDCSARRSGGKPLIAKEVSGLSQLKPYEVSGVTGIGYEIPNETLIASGPNKGERLTHTSPLRRSVHFNISACFQFPNETRPARDIFFHVAMPDGTAVKCNRIDDNGDTYLGDCMTNVQGCINFPDDITHDYYAVQNWVERKPTISSGDFSEKVGYRVNPWKPSAGVIWDNANPESRRTVIDTLDKEPSKFVADSFNWKTQGTYSFYIDRFLDATLKKTVTLSLPSIKILQNNTVDEGAATAKALLPGIYAVRVGLQKEYYDAGTANTLDTRAKAKTAEFLTVRERLYRYEGGGFNPQFEFDIPDLRFMRIRTNILIEVGIADEAKMTAYELNHLEISAGRFEQVISTDAGIKPRTFIGSTMFLAESDSGPLSPTDANPDYRCQAANCDAQFTGEHPWDRDIVTNLLPGDPGKLDHTSVKDLLSHSGDLARKLDDVRAGLEKFSAFLPPLNLDFVALSNEDRFLRDDPLLKSNNFLLKNQDAKGDLLAKLNLPIVDDIAFEFLAEKYLSKFKQYMDRRWRGVSMGAVTETDLRNLVDGQISPNLSARLCAFIYKKSMGLLFDPARGDLPYGVRQEFRSMLNKDDVARGVLNCLAMTKHSGESDGGALWDIEKKIRVMDVDSRADEFHQGYALNFHPSAGIGGNHSHSDDERFNVGVTGTGAAGLDGILQKELSGRFIKLAQFSVGASVSAGYDHSWTWGEQTSSTQDVAASTWVGVDVRPVGLHLKKYERCVAIRPKRKFIDYLFGDFFDGMSSHDVGTIDKVLTRGLMICDGQIMTTPKTVIENYYFFSQQLSQTYENDPGSMQNNPWLLSLRGARDFYAMTNFLGGNAYCMVKANQHVDLSRAPITQLQDAYRNESSTPMTPGMYSDDGDALTPDLRMPKCDPEKDPDHPKHWLRMWGSDTW